MGFKIQFGWGRKSEDRPQDDDDESDKEAKKTKKSRESPVKRLFEGFKLGCSSSEEGADQSLPDIDAVAELPDTELRSRATVEIEQLDKEKDPAEAESRIKQIMSMLLLRLQRLQDREAEVETISDPKEREVARAEIEKERAELNAEFESVEAKGSKFKLPKFNLEPFKFKFGWGSGDKDEKTTEPEPQKEEKEKKAKKPKDSSKKKLFGGFKLGFSGSADDEDADQALPEIAQDVANLPDLELRNKAREDIDKLDQETDPADAESRIKVIISMLLLRLQRLEGREAELDSITDPNKREAARAEIEAVEKKASSFKFKLPKFSLEPFKIQFGWGRKSEDRPQDDDDESDKEAKKTKKSRESPVKRLFEGFKLGFSSSEEGADQSLPDIDAVAELPDTELRSRATVEIEQLDKEKDPAEAESRIKQIMSMLLLRLQRLQDREAE